MSQPSRSPAIVAAPLILGSAFLMAFLGMREGVKYTVYADKLAGGLPTVCRGLTRHVTKTPIIVGQVWTAEKCDAEESTAVIALQKRLIPCFAQQPPQSVFDMATSHAWNVGVANTCGSAAMAAWRASEWKIGCRRLAFADSGRMVWSYVRTGKIINGKPEYQFVQGLANRRQLEMTACREGIE